MFTQLPTRPQSSSSISIGLQDRTNGLFTEGDEQDYIIESKSVTLRYHGRKFLDLNNLSIIGHLHILSNDKRQVRATVLFLSANIQAHT